MHHLVPIHDYWLEWKNRYWVNASAFNISYIELELIWILDDIAYLTKECCQKLQDINAELYKSWLKVIVKDAYRSKELYDLVYQKRITKFWKEETDKILNTRTYPHATGNTVDVALVSIIDNKPLRMYIPIENREQQVASRALHYYEDSDNDDEIEIHKNRMLLKDIMNKYWFEWIAHEYWHFDLKA